MSYTPPSTDTAASTVPLVPRACYRVLVTSANNDPSKKTNAPQNTLGVQILSPDTVQTPAGVAQTAGIEGKMYFTFSEKNLKNMAAACKALGFAVKSDYPDEAAYIAHQQEQIMGLLGKTFEMVVSSKREPMLGPDGAPLTDSAGRPIQGREVADFSAFNVVGLVKTLEEVGGAVNPY